MSSATTRLIVGLGNPGTKYARNRHNVGFMVADALAARLGLVFAPVDRGEAAAGDGVVLLKPATYMNLSGEAVTAWSAASGVPVTGRVPAPPSGPGDEPAAVAPEEAPPEPGVRPLAVCDDLALPLGSVRLRARGSSGGQNGLASLIAHLGGEEFPRLRLGIAPPDGTVDPADWPDYVLADFTPDEAEAVADMVDHAAAALAHWLEHGLEDTISRFNRRIRPATE